MKYDRMSLLGFLVFLFSMSGVFVVVLKCVCVGRGGSSFLPNRHSVLSENFKQYQQKS